MTQCVTGLVCFISSGAEVMSSCSSTVGKGKGGVRSQTPSSDSDDGCPEKRPVLPNIPSIFDSSNHKAFQILTDVVGVLLKMCPADREVEFQKINCIVAASGLESDRFLAGRCLVSVVLGKNTLDKYIKTGVAAEVKEQFIFMKPGSKKRARP